MTQNPNIFEHVGRF